MKEDNKSKKYTKYINEYLELPSKSNVVSRDVSIDYEGKVSVREPARPEKVETLNVIHQ